MIADAETVIDVIGTPVDEHVNPDPHAVRAVVDDLSGQMRDGQLLVLSSTEATTTSIEDILDEVLASPRPTRWATCCNASTASSPPAAGSPSSARTSATQSKAYFDCADRYVREVAENVYAAGFDVDTVISRFLPYPFRSALPSSAAMARPEERQLEIERVLGKQFLVVGTK